MTYRVLPDAQSDLRDIDDWVLEHFGPALADKTQARLYNLFELLAAFPDMGHARPEVEARPILFFCEKPYWIAYQAGTPLLIHRIFHGKRDTHRIQPI